MDRNNYVVYQHLFPNGKSYIGITGTQTEKRWRNGKGYEDQPKIKNAIEKYGWDNVQHNILLTGLTKEDAEEKEKELIVQFKSIENGYNTSIGGGLARASYLLPEVSALFNSLKKFVEVPAAFYENKDLAEIVNEHYLIVVNNNPHKFSLTDDLECARLWKEIESCMEISYALSVLRENGVELT